MSKSLFAAHPYIHFLLWRLLDLLGHLGLLALTSLLGSLWSGLGVHHVVPPSEAAGIVTNELLMVNIVMLSTSPEGKEMVQRPREIVAAVRIDSLEKTSSDPEIHGQDVKVAS